MKKADVELPPASQNPPGAPSVQGESARSTRLERLYFLDWLRVFAVAGVFLVHCTVIFSFFPWQIKNAETSLLPTVVVAFLILWGMPLFFLLAGASAFFALGSRTPRQFLLERLARLVLPFLIGFLLLSPLIAYFEGRNHLAYQGTLLQVYPFFFAHLPFPMSSQWLGRYGYHLWFLAFLFLYCLLALPLLVVLRQDVAQRILTVLASLCAKPGGSLLFALPLFLLQLLLHVHFPGYQDWSDFATWFAFFVFGFLLVAHSDFQHLLAQQWKVLLGSAIACSLAIAAGYTVGWVVIWETKPSYSTLYICYLLIRSIAAWSWVAVLVVWGRRYFSHSSRFLHAANEAVLPFYLVHFPMIVIIAFAVVQWHALSLIKFLVITICSLLMTLAIYEVLIRQVPILRRAFGMKPAQKREHAALSRMAR